MYIHLYFYILNNLLKMYTLENIILLLYVNYVPYYYLKLDPFLTLMLVCMWYEESNPLGVYNLTNNLKIVKFRMM